MGTTRRGSAYKAPPPNRTAAAIEKENAELRARLAEEKKKNARKTKGDVIVLDGGVAPDDDPVKGHIKDAVDRKVFANNVLLPASGPYQKMIVQQVYDALNPPPKGEFNFWYANYLDTVASAFNQTRGYITGQVKTAVIDWVKNENKNVWPDVDDIIACATRTIKLYPDDPINVSGAERIQLDQNLKLFVFYWQDILGHMGPANSQIWRWKERCYTTISNKESKMTTYLEALAAWLCENNWNYWQNWQKIKDKYPTHKQILHVKKDFQRPPDEEEGTSGDFQENK